MINIVILLTKMSVYASLQCLLYSIERAKNSALVIYQAAECPYSIKFSLHAIIGENQRVHNERANADVIATAPPSPSSSHCRHTHTALPSQKIIKPSFSFF